MYRISNKSFKSEKVVNTITQILTTISDKWWGFTLTLVGAGTGKVISEVTRLNSLELWVNIGTLIVISLTIISWVYKFYKFCNNFKKEKKWKRRKSTN